MITGIGFMLMLVAASGLDAPEPTANYILCMVALAVMLVGVAVEKE